MPRQLTLTERRNVFQAIKLLMRLKECCPSLAANDDFMSALDELDQYADPAEHWRAGDETADSEAETKRALGFLWVDYAWIRPDLLHGDRELELENCNGKELARLAFIILHEAYHADGWVDGEALARQDLQNLATWELNLISIGGLPPPCADFPCADKVLEFVKARMQETITTITNLPWYNRWFNWNWVLKWLGRFAATLGLVVFVGFELWIIAEAFFVALLAAALAGVSLGTVLLIALVLTLVWMVLEAIFG